MNGYNFTDRVRQTLQMAREESGRLNHEYVGTEHILLGMIAEGGGVGIATLENLHVDTEAIRAKIEETVKPGRQARTLSPGQTLPYTSRAKKVLELAMMEAREIGHNYVGTEHLLLGIMREEKGIAAQVLNDSGVTISQVRGEVLTLLGGKIDGPLRSSRPPQHTPPMGTRYDRPAMPPVNLRLVEITAKYALFVAALALLVAITALTIAILLIRR